MPIKRQKNKKKNNVIYFTREYLEKFNPIQLKLIIVSSSHKDNGIVKEILKEKEKNFQTNKSAR